MTENPVTTRLFNKTVKPEPAVQTREGKHLADFFAAGVAAVSGEQAVIRALQKDAPISADFIIAVGKAAGAMCLGALQALAHPCNALVVTKYQHADRALKDNPAVTVVESGHPIPDVNSLQAGDRMLDAVRQLKAGSKLLLLVSGGASALAECLPTGMTLEQWQEITAHMIARGYKISQINARRKQTSLLKDGKLLQHFAGSEVRVYAISDVEGDDIAVIGSGIGNINRLPAEGQVRLIGTNQIARDAVALAATEAGYTVQLNKESLYHDVNEIAPRIARELIEGAAGVYIWGGEPTIELPEQPGDGGRNQSLALMVAQHLVGQHHITVLVAGTDGSDGPSDAAGGIIDGGTAVDKAMVADALSRADAGTFLRQSGNIFVTGPSNTNVMDMVIAMVS
jgi:glycerate 2-kinase